MNASIIAAERDVSPSSPARRSNRLLAALSARDFAVLEPHLEPVALPRGRVLFEPGDEVTTTYFPCHRTMASLLIVTRDGREVEAATIGREGAVGGIVSEGYKPAFGRAVIQVGGDALAINTSHLEAAKTGSHRFGDLFSRYADALLAQMMQSVACNALHRTEERCARWLLATQDRAGDRMIHLTQESLAEMLGVQRTTVTAVTGVLQDRGLIRTHRGRVEVLDRPGLERTACECYRAVEDHFAKLLPEVDV
ncbi:MAG: Crp/Fnr family transcriptional regulator [Alphaproteobacteria bacterium]|nr:Crp/Fnr family transcriptional regulator [Alphaproteobacteria bacterium]MBU1514641.1 Crp/Fnr family transcriptional regulator [Alphaproteobacteria bacterium]MBU2096727.1 Crp/Fnr family transcriptional regulator [Alphaproteobacteria bacterium]MBU2150359.1 Crp/Fnr family transcriptional regulator [Alphaproteobacteria bacterium]MBU2306640.1 Crp/Fnr family transcriptional regulator [Alphaproteobacteria bacterium]